MRGIAYGISLAMPDPRSYSRFLARMSVSTLAKVLWSERGMALSPERFSHWLGVGVQQSSEPAVLRDLGGALWDYSRRRPGAVAVPDKLLEQLLSSGDVDARINGGKLLLLASNDFDEILATAERMLRSQDTYESAGGLFVLVKALDRELRSPGRFSNFSIGHLNQSLASVDIAKWQPHQLESLQTLRSYIVALGERSSQPLIKH